MSLFLTPDLAVAAQPVAAGWDLSGESPYGIAPDPQSQVILGGVLLPGIVEIKPVERGIKLEVTAAKGSSSPTIKMSGYEPAKIEFSILVWTEEQIQLLSDVLSLIEPRAGKSLPDAIPIYHEFLWARGIHSILIESIIGPSFDDGAIRLTVKGIEWRSDFASRSNDGMGGGTKTPSPSPPPQTIFDQDVARSGFAGVPAPPPPPSPPPPPPV